MRRITADIDSRSRFKLWWYITKSFIFIREIIEIDVLRSYTKGFHLVVWTNKNYHKNQIYNLREVIGDDKNRIRIDKIKKLGEQTLFYKKEYYTPKSSKIRLKGDSQHTKPKVS